MNDDALPESKAAAIAVRDVADADMAAIQEIYAHHVRGGLASFEEVPPDMAEMTRRRDAILDAGYPYRVAVHDGTVRGYAYASSYRPRPAYRHTVENSVYVDDGARRLGIGRALISDLIERCTEMGYRQMIAVIGDSENHASIGIHEKMGFRKAGLITSVGFKFGRWVDSVIMQRPLGESDDTLPDG